jgi:hypothetical protein
MSVGVVNVTPLAGLTRGVRSRRVLTAVTFLRCFPVIVILKFLTDANI